MLLINPLLLSILFFILLPFTFSSLGAPIDSINTCLTIKHVTNFTLIPNSDNESRVYHNLLNFSIQNLRFVEPKYSKPIGIILPQIKEELISSILCCRQASVEIRIRSGGHSYEGFSSVGTNGAPFAIIDMMNLNLVSVDINSETAWVQGGATLGETYYAVAKSSESHGFSAGSCPTVGSGGHIGGGGYGLLSRKYGLAADNVVDALLIDVKGQVLDRRTMGEDVFWAIRGGGSGVWGVVYAWKIQLVQVPKIVTSFRVSRPGTKYPVRDLVHKWQFISPELPDEFYLSVSIAADLPDANISATFTGLHLGTKNDAISILNQAFPELGIHKQDFKEMNWIESVLLYSGLPTGSAVSGLNDRYLHVKGKFKAKSDYVRVPIPKNGIDIAFRMLEKEPKGYVILDPYGGMMNRISSDSIPFPHREGNLFSIQYMVQWNEEDGNKSDKFIRWIRRFYQTMTPFVSKGPRAAYVNYIDLDLGSMNMSSASSSHDAVEIARVWGEKYFLRNYDRMVQVKTIIDPNNVFNNPQGIPPIPKINSSTQT